MSDDPTNPTAFSSKPIALSYESLDGVEPAGPRPRWVYAIAAIYLLLLLIVLTAPVWASWWIGEDVALQVGLSAAGLVVLGLTLMIVPVRVVRRRRVTRRSIWIPVIASGLLMGGLVYGGGIALAEYLDPRGGDAVLFAIVGGGIFVWVAWSVIFMVIAFRANPMGVGLKLHRFLIAGSVLELLVAVPAHLVVRRRTECCAGILTGLGICIGVGVMFISFGPGVLLLYHRRRKQIIRDK